jgi:hypothetical protein
MRQALGGVSGRATHQASTWKPTRSIELRSYSGMLRMNRLDSTCSQRSQRCVVCGVKYLARSSRASVRERFANEKLSTEVCGSVDDGPEPWVCMIDFGALVQVVHLSYACLFATWFLSSPRQVSRSQPHYQILLVFPPTSAFSLFSGRP